MNFRTIGLHEDDGPIVFYTQNGKIIRSTFQTAPEGFYAYKLPNQKHLYFVGDQIAEDVTSLLMTVEHAFQGLVFGDLHHYHLYVANTPRVFFEGGLSSSCPVSKETFNRAVAECNSETLNAVLYVSEYASLQGCLVNSLSAIGAALSGYFEAVSEINAPKEFEHETDDILVCSGSQVDKAYAQLDSFFVHAAGCLDYLSKCVWECVNPVDSFDSPQKLRSRKTQYGDKNKIRMQLNATGTIFEDVPSINLIEDLRNDIVHNKSIEELQRAMIEIKNGSVCRRYVLLPDYNPKTGRLEKWHSRNRFYSQKNTANELLPKLYLELMGSISSTLNGLLAHLKVKSKDQNRKKIAYDEDYGYKTLVALQKTLDKGRSTDIDTCQA